MNTVLKHIHFGRNSNLGNNKFAHRYFTYECTLYPALYEKVERVSGTVVLYIRRYMRKLSEFQVRLYSASGAI
jgi:hypothetical protein